MKTIVLLLLLLVLFEGFFLVRSCRENKALSGLSSHVEALRSQLALAAEAAAQREADLQSCKEELAWVQGDLHVVLGTRYYSFHHWWLLDHVGHNWAGSVV